MDLAASWREKQSECFNNDPSSEPDVEKQTYFKLQETLGENMGFRSKLSE